jgi:hypothetical protein
VTAALQSVGNSTVTLRGKWKILRTSLLSKITDFKRLLPRAPPFHSRVIRGGGYPSWSALYFAEISGFAKDFD